jgi:D-sedoheptulose 7-phosphate isomerase
MKTKEFVRSYLAEAIKIAQKIEKRDLEKIIDILFEAWRNGKTVFTMGNGGSLATATHFAADLAKYTIASGKPRFKSICLNDNASHISALTNDEGFDSIFSEQLIPWLEKGDVIVAFSVHGGIGFGNAGAWSQNLGKAVKLAKERKAKIIGFSGDMGGMLKEEADACVVIPTVNKNQITPQVEGWHSVLTHLVVHRLKEMIKASAA